MATEQATFGGGCFWCTEAVMLDLQGVTAVMSGYAGGHVANPSYEQVCGKQTGHAEVVQVTFDPEQISYADLLRVFFATHDPTTRDRQGNDVGPQYRSIILYASEEQERTAREVMAEITQAGIWDARLTTEVVKLEQFWPAEPEHHNYFARNPWSGYCRAVVGPKVAKFRKQFSGKLKQSAA